MADEHAGEHADTHANGHGGHGAGEGAERPRVLLFFDYSCPFCYVDAHRFEALEKQMDFELVPIPFELRPQMEEPIDLEQHGTGHSSRVDEHLARIAEKEGFAYVQPRSLPNTHRAIILAEAARDKGEAVYRTVHRAIFEAYFAEGLDIGSEEVLLKLASLGGLSSEEVRDAWEAGAHDERVHHFRHLALDIGLDATPAALICNELLVGSRPLGVLREAIERCDARREASRAGVLADAEAEGDPRARPVHEGEDANPAPKR